MKRFIRYAIAAVLIVAVAVIVSLGFSAKAAETNVLYISDTGKGDGSSASSPMGPEIRVANTNDISYITDSDTSNDYLYYSSARFYQNCVLYQAVEKLAQTGGKVVLVGDVVIDYSKTYAGARTNLRDYYLPTHGNKNITITAQGSGRLVVTEGSYINLGGDTTFENIKIVTKTGRNSGEYVDYNLAICCGMYKTVFGEGITCVNESEGSSAAAKYYLSIAGTSRYGDCTGDTSITVKSGTWNNIFGSMFGNAGNVHRGDTEINITGGTVKGYVIGGARDNSVFHYGDVNINVSGGTIAGTVYATNSAGCGYKSNKANITISGGTFSSSSMIKKNYGTLVAGGILPYITVDLSSYPSSSITKTIAGDNIIYPSGMAATVQVVKNSENGLCYLDKGYEADGLTVKVTYTNGKSAEINYSSDDDNFVMNCDSSSEGVSTVTGTYGGKSIIGFSKTVNVVNTPIPEMLGAQISVVDANGGLRFVAEMQRSAESYVTVKDYGFYVWNGSTLSADEIENIESVYGIEKVAEYGNKFRVEKDTLGIYNNSEKLTFSTVCGGISINDYGTDYYAAAYVEFEYNGQIYTGYSEPISRSVIDVANAAAQNANEDVEWIEKNIINKYAAYLSDIEDRHVENYSSEISEKLRDIVIAEMNENAGYVWTPSEKVDLTETVTVDGFSYYGKYTYTAGTKYYGMAYVNNAKAELDEFKSYVKTYKDGTNVYLGPVEGVVDFYSAGSAPYTEMQSSLYKLDPKYHEITSFFPASDYTAMVINVWNKVGTNDVWLTGLQNFLPGTGRGTVAVGGYDYTVSNYSDVIIENAGQTDMYSAYAACKRGDVVVRYTSGGAKALYMVMEDAVAGQPSLEVMMFSPTLYDVKDGSGKVIGKTHFHRETMSFASMYTNGYVPVTIPELAMGVEYDTSVYVTGFDGKNAMEQGELTGNIISNKQILSVNVKISRFDDNGEIYDDTYYCNSVNDLNVNNFDLSYFNIANSLRTLVGGKEYTLTVSADIANDGVKQLVSYKYTKPAVILSETYASYYDGYDMDFSNMTQSVIDHMKEQMNIFWTPASTFTYANLTGDTGFVPNTQFKKGVIYKGILYSNTRATLEDFAETLDSTPVYNSTVGGNVYTLSGISGTTDWNYVMGNHCSASMYHAYQQVIRLHASSRGNADMKLLGLKDLYYGVASYTDSVRKLYGYEALYESYALAQKGDFVYKRASGGHTRIVQEVNVVRDSVTGRIDPKKSSILMIEQTDTLESEVYGAAKNGTTDWTPASGYDSTWWEHTYTFELLATGNSAAIILRPTEFKTNETEKHYVGLTRKASKANLEGSTSKEMGVVESNYPIIGVYVTIELDDGTVYTATKRALTSTNAVNITSLFTSNANTYASNPDAYVYRPDFKGKSYTYTLEVELAAGRVVLDTLKVTA